MGWRALRLSLDRSTLMKAQARALLEASGGKTLMVMFPMISEPWEYEEARALFEEQVEWARHAHRKLPSQILYGAMLEVPALAEMLDQLLPVRRRPLRPSAGAALRLAEPGDPALSQAHPRPVGRGESAGPHLR